MSDCVVRASGLYKDFGSVRALDGLTLDIPRGSLFAMVGANGAGKTTFFSVVAGFLHPTSGTVEVLGCAKPEGGVLRGRLGMLPQDANFLAGVPVLEQLEFCARLQGMSIAGARHAALEALDAVGLREAAQRNPRALSHGMLKRVALCQAFIGNPEIVFLDEPTAGLDPETARRVRELVRAWRGQRTVVISSHNLAELQDLCTHVAMLHKGRILSSGSMDALLAEGCHFRCTLNSAPSAALLEALRALPEIADVQAQGAELVLAARTGTERNAAAQAILTTLLAAHCPPRRFAEGASLEQRFLEAVGGHSDGLGST